MLKSINNSTFFLALILANAIIPILSKTLYETLLHNHYLPLSFVYLSDIDDSIIQDIRFAKNYNILGHPLDGYDSAECILTKEAAQSLTKVQKEVKKFAEFSKIYLSLRVFDCYRPKIANEQLFYTLIQKKSNFKKLNFFPYLNEADIINFGFLELKNAHSRGSTVSVTLSKHIQIPVYKENHEFKTIICSSDFDNRYMFDFGIDMGTNYDCFDSKSFNNATLAYLQLSNRKLLKVLMENHGFEQTSKLNWWEFTLKNEPINETQFNFPIRGKFKKEEQNFCYKDTPELEISLEDLIKKLLF